MQYNNEKKYDFISFDITSNCNLRCPFCLNDFSKIRGNTNVTQDTFQKVIALIPLIKETGSFYFSCLFEPTLHPDFAELLYKIPKEHRNKVFFTTNLAKTLSDEEIEKMSLSGIDHINISLDTLNQNLFETIRNGIKYSTFHHNLNRIVTVFKHTATAPKINFITILIKDNINECRSILEKCATDFHANNNEFRCFWFHDYHDQKWLTKQTITKNDWITLKEQLQSQNKRFSLGEYIDPPTVKKEGIVKNCDPLSQNPPFSALRISSSGIIEPFRMPCNFYLDINSMNEPYETMKCFAEIQSIAFLRGEKIKSLRDSKKSLEKEKDAMGRNLNRKCHRFAERISNVTLLRNLYLKVTKQSR